MKDRLKLWLSTLAPRERILVGIAAAAILLTVLFLLVWEPLYKNTNTLRDEVTETRALVVQLARAQTENGGGRSGAIQGRDRSLLSVADQTGKQAGLAAAIKRMQPDGETTVRVWLEQADFASLLRWLAVLDLNYGTQVTDADISRDAQSGTVRARIDLVRATP